MAVALLVAAGSGERLGAGRPKAFVALAGRPMLEWSLAALRAAGVDRIVVAVPPGCAPGGGRVEADGAVIELGEGAVAVEGGESRSASVRAALAGVAWDDTRVVVHDAARPLVTPELFRRALDALADADCAVVAARITDTVKEAGPDRRVAGTLDRTRLFAVQTPQAFRRAALERALDVEPDVLSRATDDAWLVERAGGTVRIVESPAPNLKVTSPHDLRVAEWMLLERGRN